MYRRNRRLNIHTDTSIFRHRDVKSVNELGYSTEESERTQRQHWQHTMRDVSKIATESSRVVQLRMDAIMRHNGLSGACGSISSDHNNSGQESGVKWGGEVGPFPVN